MSMACKALRRAGEAGGQLVASKGTRQPIVDLGIEDCESEPVADEVVAILARDAVISPLVRSRAKAQLA